MSANVMLTTEFRSIVEPILNEAFDGVYDQRDDEWNQVFSQRNGIPRQYHEEPVLFGFNAAPELPEGKPVTYQAGGVLFIKRYIYKVYGMAFSISQVLAEDGDHIRIGTMFSRHLAQSMVETKETVCAAILNRAFNGSFTGGDGVALSVNNHPIRTGTFSNVLSTAANLSQSSVEQILIQVSQAVDNNGKRIRLKPRQLVVAPANQFQAETILKSVLRTGTANNDINPVKSMGLLSEGAKVMTRLTSNTAWWVQTDAREGMKLMMRRALQRSMEGDFETDSTRYKSTERYDVGWTDPRALYGTPGL